MSDSTEQKALAARAVAADVQPGQSIGFGSGSTVMLAIAALAQRAETEHLDIVAVAGSFEVEAACRDAGLRVAPLGSIDLDWSIDGADEIDGRLNLLKGRGGAILRERIVAASSRRVVIVADQSKEVRRLGDHSPLVVEVVPAAARVAESELVALGADRVELRTATGGKDGPVITEGGNLLLDCWFDTYDVPLNARVRQVPGVVETGLFVGVCDEALIARSDAVWRGRRNGGAIEWSTVANPDV
jgi:ribose 5-phosphate isomerase A